MKKLFNCTSPTFIALPTYHMKSSTTVQENIIIISRTLLYAWQAETFERYIESFRTLILPKTSAERKIIANHSTSGDGVHSISVITQTTKEIPAQTNGSFNLR